MKAILTIIFILFIGLFAQAQNANNETKVATKTEKVVLVNSSLETILLKNETKVVRVYMDSNYKVKKELSFSTKLNKSKLA